ncbi:MAG: hypothetical protein ABI598_02290 [Chloroflexota bacterium]
MSRTSVIILHAVPRADRGPLETGFAASRARNAEAQARAFGTLGADVEIIETTSAGPSFGARLRSLAARGPGGLIVLGSGSIPLATRADRELFITAARGNAATRALANNRYSADIVALAPDVDLGDLPDLESDNSLPRWLEAHGTEVADLRSRWRLQVDLDSPLDVVLVDGAARESGAARDSALLSAGPSLVGAMAAVRDVAADPRSELLVFGRSSSGTLRWVEAKTASRTRALLEERGMKTAPADQRPSRSTLGLLLERDGPESLGSHVTALADAAVIDSRVLLAGHFGRDAGGWPSPEDRFASDLLVPDGISDGWLRALTQSALASAVPILLGGHTLVGPGLRLLLRP